MRPGEFDHEKLWLAVILGGALLGWFLLTRGVPLPKCLFHEVTGFPCAGCGSTRSLRAVLAGDLGRAATLNPFMFTAYALCGLYAFYAAGVLAFRLPRLRFEDISNRLAWSVRIGVAVALLASWIWLIVDGR